MKSIYFSRITFTFILLFLVFQKFNGQPAGREIQNFNFNWKFFKGDQPGAEKSEFNDSGWRIVKRQSAGDISAPISAAMIVHELLKPLSVPQIIAG